MMKRLKMSASPAITWFGEVVWRPRAWRVRPKTITMRVNPVSRISSDGAMASRVRAMMTRTLVDGLDRLLPRLMLIEEPAASSVVMGSSGPTDGAEPHLLDRRLPAGGPPSADRPVGSRRAGAEGRRTADGRRRPGGGGRLSRFDLTEQGDLTLGDTQEEGLAAGRHHRHLDALAQALAADDAAPPPSGLGDRRDRPPRPWTNLDTTLIRTMMTTSPTTIWTRSEEAETLCAPVAAWRGRACRRGGDGRWGPVCRGGAVGQGQGRWRVGHVRLRRNRRARCRWRVIRHRARRRPPPPRRGPGGCC